MGNICWATDRFRRHGVGLALFLGILAASATAVAEEAATPGDATGDATTSYETAWGPSVGVAVPALDVRDSEGESRDLASLTGERGLLLVVSRSAVW